MKTRASLLLWFAAVAAAQSVPTKYAFDFSANPAEGYTQVPSSTLYTDGRGYGFEPVSTGKVLYFSAAVPEGSYRVKITLGDPHEDSVTTVKAELRRLMLEKIRVPAGKFETHTFVVNVRRPQIAGGGEVRLKDREKTSEAWAWDNKLTLEFNDSRPSVRSLEIEKVDNLPVLYIAGDSTSTDQPSEPFNSWGQMLTRFFKPEIVVANHGESGESLRSFIGENRLAKLLSVIKAGDYLMIQMGHNDQKQTGDGVGAFTTYKADLKRFIDEARQRAVTPILITSMHRLTFDAAGKITNSLGNYPDAVRQIAREESVALIDLNAMSKPFYEALGPAVAPRAFAPGDATHHNNYGSYQLAKCIVEGIRQTKTEIARYLVATPPYDPAHPDAIDTFDFPPSPRANAQRPAGN